MINLCKVRTQWTEDYAKKRQVFDLCSSPHVEDETEEIPGREGEDEAESTERSTTQLSWHSKLDIQVTVIAKAIVQKSRNDNQNWLSGVACG